MFPSGRTCRNFDELALACLEEWKTACGLLTDGYIESFLGGLGRIDLALAAKEASRAIDPDTGLDQLLSRLPTTAVPEPRLRVDPLEVNLGVLDSSEPRTFTLELENQGMRLLSGTVNSDAVWLTMGDAPGANEKHFHFTDEGTVVITIRPRLVSASSKPVEGRVVLRSNGGDATVIFRAEKPVKPFPDGPLAGAKSPRKIAEKAMASQKEVAPYFESGQVEEWYKDNGWIYPVKLPAASGLAAIQQFFEALGLTKPPKVLIDQEAFSFQADPGTTHSLSVEVSTPEKKPVFAHATSNVPWLEVGRARFSGRSATVPMSIPSVPNAPGQVLRGEVTVVSNGNARWVIPVTVDVTGVADEFDFTAASGPPAVAGEFDFTAASGPPAVFEPAPTLSIDDDLPAPSVALAPPPPPPPGPAPVVSGRKKRPQGASDWWVHSIPAVLLLLVVGTVVLYDRLLPSAKEGSAQGVLGPRYTADNLSDQRPRIRLNIAGNKRVGFVRVDPAAPSAEARWKRLTGETRGEPNNNTVIKIDDFEYRYGNVGQGRVWQDARGAFGDLPKPYMGRWDTFRCGNEEVDVMQYVQVVPGPTAALDTALVYYQFHNYGTKARKVALRTMLDTIIGENDNVPFLVPGQSKLVKDKAELKGDAVPEYVEAIENPNDPKNPGLIARLTLKGIAWDDNIRLSVPERVLITAFSSRDIGWDVPVEKMTGDSSVAVYWPEVTLKPGEKAHFAFTYGLGELDVTENLALSAPGGVLPGSEFTITGYVYNATKGQKVTLDLPDTLQAVDSVDQVIDEDGERAQVFWKVRAVKAGSKDVHAVSKGLKSKPIRVVVNPGSIFG